MRETAIHHPPPPCAVEPDALDRVMFGIGPKDSNHTDLSYVIEFQ